MSYKYVPILKSKKGEQKALIELDNQIKDAIIPLIEIPLLSEAMIKKGDKIHDIIESFWSGRKYFFYFMPDWYEDYDNFNEFFNNQIQQVCDNNEKAIPVIDLSLVDFVENWSIISKNGLAIRLRNNEFGEIENMLNPIFKKTSIKRNQITLIFDLQYVNENDLFSKKSVLKAALADLDEPNQFESIVISSVSFPKQFPQMDSKKIYRFKRIENEILELSLQLSKRFGFEFIYSDYGPSDIEENAFILGMSPNFKIKYTGFEEYIYIKGVQIKNGGLDYLNVKELVNILIDSIHYSGSKYSWGDKNIYEIGNEIKTNSGNLTTWVSYSMNHHITFIVNQI